MPAPRSSCPERGAGRPRLDLGDIFREHGEEYRRQHALTAVQHKAMRAIETCRTAALGGHVDVCAACGHEAPSYNSCRNRHCPKCQSLSQHRWIEKRKERILPTPYFHLVFTMPSELRPLARRNPKPLYDLLFAAATDTLRDLAADPKRLGARLGVTAVLHTWTRKLEFHPHVHCIVTGGGLRADGGAWVPARSKYLFPVQVLSRLFRGKLLAGLVRVYAAGKLDLGGACASLADPRAFADLKDKLYRKEWVVYAKRPFGGPEQVFEYLGLYTHRVGISNQRLRTVDERGVCFATTHRKVHTLPALEFIRRFLLHVLPPSFVKIRHYGLMASGNASTTLEVARACINASAGADGTITPPKPPAPPLPWREQLRQLTGLDVSVCPHCGGCVHSYPIARTRSVPGSDSS